MSERSFAITSIAAAVICGTFFYPPPPVAASAPAAKVSPAQERSAPPAAAASEAQPHPFSEVALLNLAAAPRAKPVASLAASHRD